MAADRRSLAADMLTQVLEGPTITPIIREYVKRLSIEYSDRAAAPQPTIAEITIDQDAAVLTLNMIAESAISTLGSDYVTASDLIVGAQLPSDYTPAAQAAHTWVFLFLAGFLRGYELACEMLAGECPHQEHGS